MARRRDRGRGDSEPAARAQLARLLPAYEITGEIGRGANGVVRAARHRRLERDVAIKEIRLDTASSDGERRFVQEAQVLAGFDHPHIVPVFDFIETEGRCFLVMEHLSGGTASERLSGARPESAVATAMATASALQYAHDRAVLHRDIKPDNILFSGSGQLKVTDFGICKLIEGDEPGPTATGTVIGTPVYMAPEQVDGGELGPQTDVYATGIMLYRCLTGAEPYSLEGGALAILHRHATEEAADIRHSRPDLDRALAAATMRALEREPEDRFPSAEEFGVALGRAALSAWGRGWLERAEIALTAPGPIASSARASTRSPTRPRPVRPAPPPEPDRTMAPAPQARVTARTAPRTSRLAMVLLAAAACGALATVAVAWAGPGATRRPGNLPPGIVTINGRDPATDVIHLGLGGGPDGTAPRNEVVVRPLPGGPATFDVSGEIAVLRWRKSNGSARANLTPAADGSLAGPISFSDGLTRLVVAGEATLQLDVTSYTTEVAVRPGAGITTIPGGVGIFVGILLSGWALSRLRPSRVRTGLLTAVGPTFFGAFVGFDLTVLAWVFGATEPAIARPFIAAAVGGVAGLLLGLGLVRAWRIREGESS